MLWLVQEPERDDRCAEHQKGTGEEHGAQSGPAADQSQGRTAETKRDIEEGRIGAHGKAAALRRRAADCLDAKAGIDKRKTAAREKSTDDGDDLVGRKPDQREAGGFYEYRDQRHPGAPKPIRKMAEEQARGR